VDNGRLGIPRFGRLTIMNLHPALGPVAAVQGGPFSTAQALEAGYEEREVSRLVRSKQWTRLRRGVLIETTQIPDDDEAARVLLMLRALRLCSSKQFVASHRTAATLHGLSALRPRPDLLDVIQPEPGNGRREAGVRWRSGALPASHLTQFGDVCCTSVARTVIDVARETDFREGLVVAESALNRGLTTLPDLRAVHDLCVDWSGARTAGRVVSFASPQSESPGESLSRIAFADGGLPAPEQQVNIYDALGLIGRVDFLWKQQRTIGEFDGKVKYVGSGVDALTLYQEKRREDRLREAGFEVVRFSWSDIINRPAWVIAQVRQAFARAARRYV
jgi:hypothetical protein